MSGDDTATGEGETREEIIQHKLFLQYTKLNALKGRKEPLESNTMAFGSGTDGGANGVSASIDSSEATGMSLKIRVAEVRVKGAPSAAPPSPTASFTRVQDRTTSATPAAVKQGADKEKL